MDSLKHECGIAMVRLLKPLSYYHEKYGSWQYGIKKLYLLMEKQRNRGQEGAGVCCVKLDAPKGTEYILRKRENGHSAINTIFQDFTKESDKVPADKVNDIKWIEDNIACAGEVYMGHLRYSTTGRSGSEYIHPFLRRNNWRNQSLLLCGNFNLTNVGEIFDILVKDGQHPRMYADTFMMLELMGSYLDRAVAEMKASKAALLDIAGIIRKSAAEMDGGYIICGVIGTGDMFIFRDPAGIRSAYYYMDDEIMVAASERAVIQTVMNVKANEITDLPPGHAFILRQDGQPELARVYDKDVPFTPCSFERIYFSRGSDADIYKERKMLGRLLVKPILDSVAYDLEHTVFSFIPNTAEAAFFGMLEGLEDYLISLKKELIQEDGADIEKILSMKIRSEKVAIKDVKLRTFIAGNSDSGRDDLAAHVYDITYGSINAERDNLVVIDDSIVRGTTLKQSIIKILDRLGPKKIVVVSSSPQIRYPDYYGIDMRHLDELIAFNAAIELLKEKGKESLIHEVYKQSKAQANLNRHEVINHVKRIYDPFTDLEIAEKIAKLLTPQNTKAEVQLVYQDIPALHAACPDNKGDWYFSGDFPTPGGNALVNSAFIEYYEKTF